MAGHGRLRFTSSSVVAFLLAVSSATGAGRLSGRVVDTGDAPLRGVVVVVQSLDYELPPYREATGKSGEFSFDNLPGRRYRLTISKIGYRLIEPPPAAAGAAYDQIEVRVGDGLVLRMAATEPDEPAEAEPAAEPTAPETAAEEPPEPQTPLVLPEYEPSGFAGRSWMRKPRGRDDDDFVPVVDRWRLGLPEWDRHPGRRGHFPLQKGRWWDPYNQNVLKGDYPIIGQSTFLNLSVILDNFGERRKIPVPSAVSAEDPLAQDFFGNGNLLFYNGNAIFTLDLFHGDTGFKPVDWRLRFTPVANFNNLRAQETGVVNIDPGRGTKRRDGHIGIQEGFFEVKLADVNREYDFINLRVGVQGFISDFRGFIFADNELGARLYGNWGSNRYQWNLAAFNMIEKDTNSLLNTTDLRHQEVYIANLYGQDFIWPGYTIQGSVHLNVDHAGRDDKGGLHFDRNGFLVRPAPIGDFAQFVPDRNNLRVRYLGLAGDGHIGILNISHAFYLARGRESHNPIAGRETRVDAKLAAAEFSVDRDWRRYRASMFWAQGDRDPLDGKATGFDSIFDNNNFAGGGFSFWNRQTFRLTGTGVALVGGFSLLNSLRSSKDEGQSNFVNPGLFLYNLGADIEVTPKLKLIGNVNYLRFHRTDIFDEILFQPDIPKEIGLDASVGILYRPMLIDNFIINSGFAVFYPGDGFKDIYTRQTLYAGFLGLTLTY